MKNLFRLLSVSTSLAFLLLMGLSFTGKSSWALTPLELCIDGGGQMKTYSAVVQVNALGKPLSLGESIDLCWFGKAATLDWSLETRSIDSVRLFLEHPAFVEKVEDSAEGVQGLVPTLGTRPDGSTFVKGFEVVTRPPVTGAVPGLRFYSEQGHSFRASEYCRQLGGSPRKFANAAFRTSLEMVKLCVFSDGSAIEANTLYWGPEAEVNLKLTEIFKSK